MRERWLLLAAVVLTLSCVVEDGPRVAPHTPAPVPRPRAQPDEAAVDDPPPVAARPIPPGAYDLGKLPVLSKVLFYVRENYFDKQRFNYRNMALGALDFVQRDVPEVVVERGQDLDRVRVSVAGNEATFSLRRIDAVWSLRSTLQRIFQFVQANLPPLPPAAEGPRLLEMETAAVNGLLYTLDPHSVLLDPATYQGMRSRSNDDRVAAVGLGLEKDASDRLSVFAVEPGSPAASVGIAIGDRITRIDGDPTQHMMIDAATDELHGAVGSKIELVLERTGRRSAQKVTLERALIRAASIAPAS
jgi:carboxyl-terminal processing protease